MFVSSKITQIILSIFRYENIFCYLVYNLYQAYKKPFWKKNIQDIYNIILFINKIMSCPKKSNVNIRPSVTKSMKDKIKYIHIWKMIKNNPIFICC